MSSSHKTQSIKYFGTSWATRGFTYWRKRVLLTTFFTSLLALSVWGVAVITNLVATHMRGTGRIALLVVLLLALAWSLVYGLSLTRRTSAEKELGVPPIMRSRSSSESRDRAGWTGVGAGIVAGPLVLIAQVFIVGTLAAAVFSTLQRYVSIEEFEAATGKRVPRREDSDYASLTIVPLHRQQSRNAKAGRQRAIPSRPRK